MRNFDKLDTTSLKAFYFAAMELNFTKAAKAAGLTQSGVSQHIQKLEEELGLKLFLRQHKQMQLSEAGRVLLQYVETYLDSLDSLMDRLQGQGTSLKGIVNYAMPNSCLFTPHLPLLLKKKAKEFPDVELKVRICDSEEVLKSLLEGRIDFGFVTKNLGDRNVEMNEFAREEHVMVSRDRNVFIDSIKDVKSLKFVSHPGMDDLFGHWLLSEFPKTKSMHFREMNIVCEINSLTGAIKMAEGGVGVGIFPKHCIATNLEAKTLFIVPTKNPRIENPIYMVTLRNREVPIRVQAVINAFWEMKKM